MGELIFCLTPFDSFEIWLWIQIFYLSDVQRPNFLIAEYLSPMDLIAIAPPDQIKRECVISGSIHFPWIFRVLDSFLTVQ